MYTTTQIASFAFRNGCSYVGGRPCSAVLHGQLGEMVFFFKPDRLGNYFFQWVRMEHDARDYKETFLKYKGNKYAVVFLKVSPKISKKFLLAFRQFVSLQTHLVNYF